MAGAAEKWCLRIRAPIPGLGLFPGEILVYHANALTPFMAVRGVDMNRATFMALAESPQAELVSGGPMLRVVKGGGR